MQTPLSDCSRNTIVNNFVQKFILSASQYFMQDISQIKIQSNPKYNHCNTQENSQESKSK